MSNLSAATDNLMPLFEASASTSSPYNPFTFYDLSIGECRENSKKPPSKHVTKLLKKLG
jgi:hypothetical protein